VRKSSFESLIGTGFESLFWFDGAPSVGINSLKSLSKSSTRRSTQRVCNDLLLRFGSSVAARKSQNSAENRARGC
jgi:hypothetical protein